MGIEEELKGQLQQLAVEKIVQAILRFHFQLPGQSRNFNIDPRVPRGSQMEFRNIVQWPSNNYPPLSALELVRGAC